MLTTLAVIAMVVIAAYLWRSSNYLHHISAQPHGENDITSTGAELLMRSICVGVLIVAVLFVTTSGQMSETSPQDFEDLDSLSAAAERPTAQE